MNNKQIGENMKILRGKRNWKRSYVSKRAEIDENRYKLLERSERVPTWEELFKISRLYGITIDDLMFKEMKK